MKKTREPDSRRHIRAKPLGALGNAESRASAVLEAAVTLGSNWLGSEEIEHFKSARMPLEERRCPWVELQPSKDELLQLGPLGVSGNEHQRARDRQALETRVVREQRQVEGRGMDDRYVDR